MFDEVLTPSLNFECRFQKSYLRSCVKILLYHFTWTKFRSYYKNPQKLVHAEFDFYFSVFKRRQNEKIFFQSNQMTFSFPLPLSHFIILLASKYLLMFFDFDALRTMYHFAFCFQIFPACSSERSNFPLAKITLESPLLLVQCKVFWFCPNSVLIQPWCTILLTQLTISNQFQIPLQICSPSETMLLKTHL